MSSITAQQAKLDPELVLKEKRIEIRKCNGRLNPGKTQREPTFQVVLDALALTPCYSTFLTTTDVPEVYMHQFWDSIQKHDTSYRFRMDKKKKFYLNLKTFRDIFQICPRVHCQDFNELPTNEDIVTFFKELVSPKEPTRKSKRVKRPAKKSTTTPTTGVVIRDTLVMSLSKKKEKIIVEKRKGIVLLSEVVLTEEDQYEEVCKKILRDFHKTHPSGSCIVTTIDPSAAKIKPSATNEGIGAKPGVPNVTEEELTKSESQSCGRDKDDSNNDHDSSSKGSDQESDIEEVEDDKEENCTSTNDEDETNVESKGKNKADGDEDKGMDYTTNQFDDDVDVRLNE
ncbi:hypothetical protein Tco_1499014 [Tanacetum coccineum]